MLEDGPKAGRGLGRKVFSWTKRGRPSARPLIAAVRSGLENSHDLKRPWVHHQDLVADEDELISAPFRIDRHNFRRERMEGHFAGNAGADRNREIGVADRRNVLIPDHGGDLGALLRRKLGASAGLADGGLGLAVRRALLLRVEAVFTAL